MGNRLYVGNLPFSATTETLRAAFAPSGDVTDVHIVTDRESGQSRGPLDGIPVLVKDNLAVTGRPATAGSPALALAGDDESFCLGGLRAAGAVIIGKTNLHELAYGITSISSMGGQTRNPYDLTRNPGGSSGGTGAAVTANFAAAGMGRPARRIPRWAVSFFMNVFHTNPVRTFSAINSVIPVSMPST